MAVAATLAAGLAVPAIAISGTFAAPNPTPNPVSVISRVTDTDPAWVVDFVVTFDGPVCPNGGTQTLWYLVAPKGSTAGTADNVDACQREAGLGPNEAVIHFNILGRTTQALSPSVISPTGVVTLSQVALWTSWNSAVSVDGYQIGGSNAYVTLPTAPVWAALGDGYSSQLQQPVDGNTTAPGGYNPNDASKSWVGNAVSDINNARRNTSTNANVLWSLTGVVIATDGSTSATVAGAQSTQMASLLAQHVIPRPAAEGGPLSSWNWVSVSAGLVDAGIPAAMTSFYTTNPVSQTNNLPWAPGTGACPNLSAAASAIAANGATWKASLTSMANAAFAADAHVHIVQVLYPFLTEPSSPCATGANGNQAVMNALDSAIDITGSTRNARPLDLRVTFGNAPTGTVANNRADTRLWLTRPAGYPYPNPAGVSGMQRAAVSFVNQAAADVDPPEVTWRVEETPAIGANGQRWWRANPSHIDWTATDASGIAASPSWTASGGAYVSNGNLATYEGNHTYLSPIVCDTATPQHCTQGKATFGIDSVAPHVTVAADRDADRNGWYSGLDYNGLPQVDVFWYQDDNPGDGVDATSDLDPATVLTDPVVINQTGTYTVTAPKPNTCDMAGNCTPNPTLTLKADFDMPSATPVLTGTDTVPSAGGWVTAPVKLTWTVTDQANGSGIDTTLPALPTGTVNSGVQTFAGQVCDVAGNCINPSVTIKVDTQAPTMTIAGAAEGQTFTSNTLPAITCAVVDQPGLSGPNGCTVSQPVKGTTNAQGVSVWTYTLTGADEAGNTVTQTLHVNVSGLPTDTVAPVIKVPTTPVAIISGTNVPYPVSATDNVDGTDPVVCTPASNKLPLGVSKVTCTSTDKAGNSSTATFNVVVGAKPAGGGFVIGDRDCSVGGRAYFWGSQWRDGNHRSRDDNHDISAFKGYADTIDMSRKTWTSRPGNSSKPPDTIAEWQTVIVTSSARKSGSTLSGDIVGYAIVHVDTSYWRAPGHIGAGDIVGYIPA